MSERCCIKVILHPVLDAEHCISCCQGRSEVSALEGGGSKAPAHDVCSFNPVAFALCCQVKGKKLLSLEQGTGGICVEHRFSPFLLTHS